MIVYLVDTETTGLNGCAHDDKIVDIGIVKVDTVRMIVEPTYSKIVGYDVSKWSDNDKNAWIFSHSNLRLSDVSAGKPLDEVVDEVHEILNRQICTSYNTDFDFERFLKQDPWNVNCELAPDVMLKAWYHVPGDYVFDDGSASWPRLEKAYRTLCPDDPVCLGGPQAHRALPDAMQASHVMLRLIETGGYPRDITLTGTPSGVQFRSAGSTGGLSGHAPYGRDIACPVNTLPTDITKVA
jgi:DNA polymerase III epsilon subunit-like protein